MNTISTYQINDVVVISDICEACHGMTAVGRSGHLVDHMVKIDDISTICHGSGFISFTVINLIRDRNQIDNTYI